MSTIDFTTPALQLTATLDGYVKVLIDDSTTTGFFASGGALAGCNSTSIKSVSLLVATPNQMYSNTLNGFEECTYSYDNISRIISEISTLTVVPVYAEYIVTLKFVYMAGSTLTTAFAKIDAFRVLGDPVAPTISAPITQGSTPGVSLKLKVSPNSKEGLPLYLTGREAVAAVGTTPAVTAVDSSIDKVIIFKDGVALAERAYAHDGIYEVTGLTANVEYSFAVQMKTTQGYQSDPSASVKGTPVLTFSPTNAVEGTSGSNGDYSVLVAAESRAKLATVGATDAQITADQLIQIDVYAHIFAADDLLAESASIDESKAVLIGTIKRDKLDAITGVSSTPAKMLSIEGAYNGCHVKLFSKATNGHGQGARTDGYTFRVMGAVSAPAVSYSLLGGNKYEISVRPGAHVVGNTLIGYKVTASVATGSMTGTFAGSDLFSSSGLVAHLRAIEKVTSSGVTGKSDVISLMAVSKVTFQLTGTLPADFKIAAEGIYEKTHQLTQVLPLDSVVLGKDLRLAAGTAAGSSQTQKLEYDERISVANTNTTRVFADAGFRAAFTVFGITRPAVAGNILAGDPLSAVASKDKVPVLTVAAWDVTGANAPTAEFVSASGDKAIFKISMPKYVTDNKVKYTISTAKQTNQALTGLVFVDQLTFNGNFLDAPRVSANIEVPRGERTKVQVRVSEFDGLDMISQSAAHTMGNALTVAGQDAYSGSEIMSYGHKGAVTFSADDKRSIFGASANGPRIALELRGIEDAHMVPYNLIDADWTRATKIYLVGADGAVTLQSAVTNYTNSQGSFAESSQNTRHFDVYTLLGLTAMTSYSYEIRREWLHTSGEILYDASPITVTVVPTVAVEARDVNFFAADGVVNSVFEIPSGSPANGASQMKAIKALGGVFNAILISNLNGGVDQIDQSSSASFTSVVTQKGIQFLSSCAQYLSPNFGKLYNVDTQYVRSSLTTPQQVYFGAVPATLSPVKVESIKSTSNTFGLLISWPELASGREVDVYAVFDDATAADDDEYALLNTGGALSGISFFISHSTMLSTLSVDNAEYYGQGVTIRVVQKDTTSLLSSLPASKFHMPVGQTQFAAADFDVISGANELCIKYNKTSDADVYWDFAGNSVIPATITYTDTNTAAVNRIIGTLKVADITSANGVQINGLDDAKSYTISIAIEGNATATLNLTTNSPYSPAAAPKAVSDLKVANTSADSLTVTFAASSGNGNYVTPASYNAYVSRDVTGGKEYLSNKTGSTSTNGARVNFVLASGEVLTGLKSGSTYTVEIESIFAAAANDTTKTVLTSAQGTPSALPVIKDFRVNGKNNLATMIVDLRGAKLNTCFLLTNSGSVLNIDLAAAAVHQSNALSKANGLQNANLSIALPAGVTGAVAIVANSNGCHMAGHPNNAQGANPTNDTTGLYAAVTNWVNL